MFKALLFLGAGAVLHATHTRNMEEMGGLIEADAEDGVLLPGRRGGDFRAAAAERVRERMAHLPIAAAGFRHDRRAWSGCMFPISGAMLALTGALAAACFVKAFGITFLAQPRSEHAAQAHEASPTMLLGQGLLTAACVFLGLFPTVFLKLLDPVTQQLTGQPLSAQLSRGERLGARQRGGAGRHGLDAGPRAVGIVAAGRCRWCCGCCSPRARKPGAGRRGIAACAG